MLQTTVGYWWLPVFIQTTVKERKKQSHPVKNKWPCYVLVYLIAGLWVFVCLFFCHAPAMNENSTFVNWEFQPRDLDLSPHFHPQQPNTIIFVKRKESLVYYIIGPYPVLTSPARFCGCDSLLGSSITVHPLHTLHNKLHKHRRLRVIMTRNPTQNG